MGFMVMAERVKEHDFAELCRAGKISQHAKDSFSYAWDELLPALHTQDLIW
jgi:hypothetical protein